MGRRPGGGSGFCVAGVQPTPLTPPPKHLSNPLFNPPPTLLASCSLRWTYSPADSWWGGERFHRRFLGVFSRHLLRRKIERALNIGFWVLVLGLLPPPPTQNPPCLEQLAGLGDAVGAAALRPQRLLAAGVGRV